MFRKITSFATAFALILMLIVGCGGPTVPTDTYGDTSADTSVATDQLEVKDFGGYEFNILVYNQGKPGSSWQFSDFGTSEESAGELINDAVYNRNLMIEERYNITIKNNETGSPLTKGRNSILSGSDEYDIIMPYIDESFKLAEEGLLIDLVKMPGIDIDRSWWDAAIKRDLALGGKLYVITGDISMADEELNYAIFFNKAMIAEYNLDDCYQLVRDDKWNLDTVMRLSAAVTHDINGDSILGEDDVYGLLTDYSVAPVWFFSAGGQLASLNADGKPQLLLGDEKSSKIIDKLAELFQNKEAVLNVVDTKGSWAGFNLMFQDNRGLFRVGSIYNITSFRDMVTDFGVLPYPKLDEAQSEYYHIIATQLCAGICVPKTASDLSRTGLLLDALASESKDTVTKAYYDINLYKKLARDNESGEMLDIIFASKRYDLAKTFGWGGFEAIIRSSVKSGQNFASLYAAAKTKAQAEMEKSYEVFK